tara:strand:+ start:3045 stop:3356 length:312 start_codon:yes stop_codon:yes gene_type:complete
MSKVENVCGPYPVDFIKQDIGSNPDFVFTNDAAYPTVQVWDIDGNTVFVNSFIECEHYVSGGWYFSPVQSLENNLQLSLMFLSLGLLLIKVVVNYLKKNDYLA